MLLLFIIFLFYAPTKFFACNACNQRGFGVNFKMLQKSRLISRGLRKKRTIRLSLLLITLILLVYSASRVYLPQSQEFPGEKNTHQTPPPYQLQARELPPPTTEVKQQVKRGDTIIDILKREGLAHNTAQKLFTQIKPVYDLRKINAGKKYILHLTLPNRHLHTFRYQIEPNRYLEVIKDRNGDTFKGKIITVPYVTKKALVKGEITISLFMSILKCGEKPELSDKMADLYEYDIDFNRDLQKGDSFALIVEKKYLGNKFVEYGDILAAEFVNCGKAIRVIRYTDPSGLTAYYHPDGSSVRKMFLRCPLPFMRVTSRYGNRRHPVLGFSSRHMGVDFAAPVGTRVRASASGVILQKGYNRSRGYFIKIRHPNRYVSNYYHLSRFAARIRSGVKVEQGEVIGYVGNTGLSTGPHLHYGLMKNGRFLNPLCLNSPTKNPVKKIYLDAFKKFAGNRMLFLTGTRMIDLPREIEDVLLNPTAPKPLPATVPFNF